MGITDFFSDLLSSVSFVQDVHAEAPADDDESKEGGDDEAKDEDGGEDGGDDKEEGGDEEGGDEEEGGDDDDDEEEEEEEEEEPMDPKPQLEEGMFFAGSQRQTHLLRLSQRIDADQILNCRLRQIRSMLRLQAPLRRVRRTGHLTRREPRPQRTQGGLRGRMYVSRSVSLSWWRPSCHSSIVYQDIADFRADFHLQHCATQCAAVKLFKQLK
jgi:hypothetical protein